MGRRGARHLRHRKGRLTIPLLLLAVTVLGTASAAAYVRITRQRAEMDVIIVVGGAPRIATVAKPATVGSALEAAAVVPRAGQLLSLVSRKVLDPARAPATLSLDGLPAGPDLPVLAGATIEVFEPLDTIEDAVEGDDVVPAPPMPEVVKALWHPGQPGSAITRKGAVSGEILSQIQLQAPVGPAPVTEKLVALTFDDGPWPTTPQILRVLQEKNAKATFCVVTRQLRGAGLTSAKNALADGHQLCNHTVSHDQKLPSKPQKTIDDEIIGANNQLQERLGTKPTYYRPPGGNLGPSVIATAKAQGQGVLLWTVDTKDFQKPPPEEIVNRVMGQVQPGGVVLLHDGGGDRGATLAALPVLIDRLRADGYELVLPDAVAPVAAAPVGARPTV